MIKKNILGVFYALVFPLLFSEKVTIRFVSPDNNFFIANVLVWNTGIDVATTNFLEFVTIIRVRETNIVAEHEFILTESSLP